MKKLIKMTLSTLFCLIQSGCGSLFPSAPPRQVFILASDSEKFCDDAGPRGVINSIQERDSPEFYSTQKIFFRNGAELGSYQLSEWSEPTTQRLFRLLTERLRCEGYKLGSLSADSNASDIVFSILDFSHQATNPPGIFQGMFRIQRLNNKGARETVLKVEAPADSFDVKGARKAADVVVQKFLDQATEWLKTSE